MRPQRTLTITSLLSILFFSWHWADEVARGIEAGGFAAIGGLLILLVWLYATLVLVQRRSGLVILLLASLLAAGVPVVHMNGAGLVGRHIANTGGIFFWVWTLIALGVTGAFSLILSARALWGLRRGQ